LGLKKEEAMAGDGETTTRLSLRELGQQTVLEPGIYETLVNLVDQNLPSAKYSAPTTPATAGTGPVAATNAAITYDYPEALRHVRITLTDFVVTVDDSDGEYGGSAFVTLPDRNIIIVNAEANLSVVKGNVTDGIAAADDITMGIGTAVASNNTLSTTMQNIIPVTTIDTDALTVTFAASKFSAVGTAVDIAVPDAANNVLYLNATAVGAVMDADDTLTCTGTIDLWYYDVGNVTS
jgi:hypothetical protein